MAWETYYSIEDIQQQLRFHKEKLMELRLSGVNPNMQKNHSDKIKHYEKLKLKAVLNRKVDITHK